MIIKKEGKINEIIYENTTYHSGKYSFFPIITNLNRILEKIIESKSTTEYIRITPFYRNERVDMQIEFEEYMFYIECRENLKEKEVENHLLDCLDTHYETITIKEIEMGKILYPLCKYDDAEQFGFSFKKYRQYLDELLPVLFETAKIKMQLKDDDLAFGYFCFEVHSG
ncbi:hypothetical protein [Lysinibacillus sp. NPDC093692]|uniref:hypothetical protein n=1 Tax=Lysinibacillus sp. NPDC093692 TaxID=3390578 RepID=UPI003CFE3BDB